MQDDLIRIEAQARLLAERAATLRVLRRRHDDRGAPTPTTEELHDATIAMQAAFMAVLRVTAEYL